MAAGRLAKLPPEPGHPRSLRIVIRSLTLHRALRLGLLLIALSMVSTVGSKPAMAKAKSCADQVIADWYDDGRIGKIYPSVVDPTPAIRAVEAFGESVSRLIRQDNLIGLLQ